MAVTSGFYNSSNGDRRYSAEDFGSLFEGIFTDGVFEDYPSQGNKFEVSKVSGTTIKVGPGKGWFKNTWIYNDSDIVFTCTPDSTYARYYSVFIKVDKSAAVRSTDIHFVAGDPAPDPVPPERENTSSTFWYDIADVWVNVSGGTGSEILIYNKVGTNIPFIRPYPYDVVEKTPAIWITDYDIPMTRGSVVSIKTPDYRGNYIRDIFNSSTTVPPPHIFPDIPNHIQRPSVDPPERIPLVPKKYDIVIGKNGYYGEISAVNVTTYVQEDDPDRIRQYEITVFSSGFYIGGSYSGESSDDILFVRFKCNCERLNAPITLDEWTSDVRVSIECDSDYSKVYSYAHSSSKRVIAILTFSNRFYYRSPENATRVPEQIQLLESIINNSTIATSTGSFIFRSSAIECNSRGTVYFQIYWDDASDPVLRILDTLSTDTDVRLLAPTTGIFDSSTGQMRFFNMYDTEVFSIQLPVYDPDDSTSPSLE